MKFDCDAKMLDKALSAVVRVVPARTTLPMLGHVLLRAEKSGLTLTTTDLEVGIRTTIEAEVAEAGATTVPAKLLAGVVGELHEDRVTMALKDNRLRISAGRSNTTLATADAEEFPPGPQPVDGDAIRLPREELLTAIAQVRPAVSTDEARPVLTGVLMSLDGKRLTLVTTDGHRLVERHIDGVQSPQETVIVPVKALAEMGRAFKDEAGEVELRFASGRNQVFFGCGLSEVTSRLIEGQYPNYDQAIPKQTTAVVRVARAELARAVRMVGLVSESVGSQPVSLFIDASGIRVTAQALDVGEAEVEIEAELEGKPTYIALRSRFLLDALAAHDADRVELQLNGAVSPALIRAVGVESCTCVVMPIRMAVAPAAKARSEAA
jgi:DNA polymerase III subunit beta